MRAGLAIKPGTPLEAAEALLPSIDLLLVMTVEPGFGGQHFRPEMLDKVRAAAARRAAHGAAWPIEVDGGIAADTAPLARAAGADVFVAGNAIFRQNQPHICLEALRKAVTRKATA
jgi:ribulose-phosphate 3-epimerase